MAEYASKGVAGTGLGLGIAGTALGLLGGGLGNVLGTGWNNGCVAGNGYAVCSDNMPINRYEAGLEKELAAKDGKISLLESTIYTDSKLNDLRNYMERKFDHVEHELCEQKVYNATNIATVNCIANQVNQLFSLTKLVVPNTSICPGWGDVTVSVTPAAAG